MQVLIWIISKREEKLCSFRNNFICGGTSESEQQSTASKQISMENIEITSKVDTEKAGVYTVNYHYTSEETGYDCNANLIVVVE